MQLFPESAITTVPSSRQQTPQGLLKVLSSGSPSVAPQHPFPAHELRLRSSPSSFRILLFSLSAIRMLPSPSMQLASGWFSSQVSTAPSAPPALGPPASVRTSFQSGDMTRKHVCLSVHKPSSPVRSGASRQRGHHAVGDAPDGMVACVGYDDGLVTWAHADPARMVKLRQVHRPVAMSALPAPREGKHSLPIIRDGSDAMMAGVTDEEAAR
eukprot:758235-Hanusia_phi.AAC.3